ncbi:MAG: HAD hydrolase family protein, partial [Nitrosopumilus sp.]
IPLFKVAKTSVALGNASDFVRSEATMCVSASSGDGVLEALDKLAPKLSEI